MEIYCKEILDHHQNPKNRGVIERAHMRAKEESPLCGCSDWMEIFLKIKDGKIKDARFQGEGCVIFLAAASMLTEKVRGKTVAQARGVGEAEIRRDFGDNLTSFRETCAFLPLKTLRTALNLKDK